jgi:GTP-binding protein Era
MDAPPTPTHSGFVAILGKPNVGKSTLLNTLLGVKVAPITSKPQTTRRGVRGIYSEGERQLVLVDTPGLHRGRTALDAFMNREIRDATADVEMILWVVDLRHPPVDEDRDVARLIRSLADEATVILVGNKLDVAKYPNEALALYQELLPGIIDTVYQLSAQNNPEAVYDLRSDLLERLPESPFFFPDNIRSDQTREAWASELIRESAMVHLRQEIPYSVAVQVIEWKERKGDERPLYIAAEIWVDRANHRPMVVGKGGKMIREIGKTARKQLQLFLDRQVYLDLEVEVHANWREDVEALRQLGYQG